MKSLHKLTDFKVWQTFNYVSVKLNLCLSQINLHVTNIVVDKMQI